MSLAKRPFSEVSRDTKDSDSALPFSWREMPNGDFARFSLYESSPQLRAWMTCSAYYVDTACLLLQGAFKAHFIRHVNFAAYSKCIMWNDLRNTPKLNGYLKSPNIPLALTQPVAKKPHLSSKDSFDLLEKQRLSQNVEYYEISDDNVDHVDVFTKQFNSTAHLKQVVEELELVRVVVKGIDMYQNRKMLAYHKAFCTIEGLRREDAVTMYHGTSELALNGGLLDSEIGDCVPVGGIISCGLNESRAQRTAFGRGIYVSADFEVAKRFAMERHNINGSTAVVLILSCYLGKIRQINTFSTKLDSFVDEQGDLCHTKFVPTMNYHILSNNAQACVRYGIRFQIIDNVTVFPAKIQLEKDKQLQRLANARTQMAKLIAQKLELETEMALLATNASKGGDDTLDANIGRESSLATAASSANSKSSKDEQPVAASIAKDQKVDVSKLNTRIMQKRTVLLPLASSDVHSANGVAKGALVYLTKMTQKNQHLMNCTGVVKQIVTDTVENNSKTYFMVEVDDTTLHTTIAQKNIKKEKANCGPGYIRFGALFQTHYFICCRNKLVLK